MQGVSAENMVFLFSGLALFLYGMNTMSDGLEGAVSSKMKKIIELFTVNPFVGVLVGCFVTAIIQSSSATTVMVVGFVNAGVMNLYQAVGLIMGANIGTTVTAQMVSLNLTVVAPYAIIIGVLVMFISKNNVNKKYGQIMFGFGVLFMGMDQMGASMQHLQEVPEFKAFIAKLSAQTPLNTLLLLAIGMIFTGIIQSSSVTTAILVTMVGEGAISAATAFPMVMGANIGTTMTAMLSSIGASKAAVKAAIIHLLFNVIGVGIFVLAYMIFREQGNVIINSLGSNPKVQIANVHTIFNVGSTLMIFPFSKYLVKFVNFILPEADVPAKEAKIVKGIDDRMLETPMFAIMAVKNEILRMGNTAIESYNHAVSAFISGDKEKAEATFETEKIINDMEKNIYDFLIKMSNSSLSEKEHAFVDNMFNIVNDFERIGDHADNIAETAMIKIDDGLVFSEKAIQDFRFMSQKVSKSLFQAVACLEKNDRQLAEAILEREGEIDRLQREYRREHIKRLNDQLCIVNSGVLFLDLLSNLERIGDHATNIAYYVLDRVDE